MRTPREARSVHLDRAGDEGVRLVRDLAEVFVGLTAISIIAVCKVFGRAGGRDWEAV
jgi:hypothetical protein